jgi:polyphosphate glucokinase
MNETHSMKILVIDVGGTNIKIIATGRRTRVKITSGPNMTARQMVAAVCAATAGWKYDAVSIGCPGPVVQGRVTVEPVNLGGGWVGFDFKKAFGRPVKIINDAAMQALGSYEGGQMLFLGLGTGLGSALVSHHGSVIPLELAHLPYKKGLTFEDYVGLRGLKRLGKRKWLKHVAIVAGKLKFALQADYVVIGGGNSRLVEKLPPDTRLGDNANAFRGGFRLWKKP